MKAKQKHSKTIPVSRVLQLVEQYLAYQSAEGCGPNRDMRLGAASLAETILHETGNYDGFCYMPGFDWKKDDSRRFYYRTERTK